jgi:hypothetical protein
MSMSLSPLDIQHLYGRINEFGALTPRELSIYLSGQADGKAIKADEIQLTITRLELMLNGAPFNISYPV